MLTDSHCHLNLLDLSSEFASLDQIITACKVEQLEHLLCIAIDLKAFPEILAIANKYDNISISAGVHPNEDQIIHGAYNISSENLYHNLLEQASNKKVVAIGETGLDFYRSQDSKLVQTDRLVTHIDIAKKLTKPLIIHTRNAPDDTIKILQEHAAGKINGVMHCFTESWQVAKQALDMGFYISISGIVTFKNATQIQEVASKVPLDRLLIETDSPYLAPIPHRGKPNYPQYVKYVAMKIAELRNMDFTDIAKHTTENFYKLFNINKSNA